MRVGLRAVEKSSVGEDAKAAITNDVGDRIGFITFAVRDEWLKVRWIELAMEHRRRGLGAEAVRLLEDEAAERWGVRRVRAHVPVDVGLALYFWLRLGYRPEGEVADTMAMTRTS